MCFRRAFIYYERAVTSLVPHAYPSLSVRYRRSSAVSTWRRATRTLRSPRSRQRCRLLLTALPSWCTRSDRIRRDGARDPTRRGGGSSRGSRRCVHTRCEEGRALAREPPLCVSRPTRLSPRSQELQSGWKVNLDCQYPESAVYKVQPCATYPPYNVGAPKPGAYGGQQSYGGQQGYGGQGGGQGGLPFGWTSGVDQQSGQTYYYNEQTGQSQWDPPR